MDQLEIRIIKAWIRIQSWNHRISQIELKSDSGAGSRAGIVTPLEGRFRDYCLPNSIFTILQSSSMLAYRLNVISLSEGKAVGCSTDRKIVQHVLCETICESRHKRVILIQGA